MNSIEITRTNGNIPKALPNKDHMSAMLLVVEEANDEAILISSVEDWTVDKVQKLIPSPDVAEENMYYDITLRMIKAFYAMAPGASLWLGAYTSANGIVEMQRKAGGEIRQMSIMGVEIDALIGYAEQLEQEDMPLSLVVGMSGYGLYDLLTKELPVNERISIVLGEDENGNPFVVNYALGAIAAAAVNESISWVRKFPVPVSGTMIEETPISSISKAVLDGLDEKGFIFLRSYTGLNGYYFNDSRTMADPTSDYNRIESVRTMDKAVRGIRTYLLPELGAPLKLDPETGCLAPETVKYLETVASQQLTAMEKAGEISGWSVEIDPAQNVLATSTVEFVIKNVPIGVMRKASVKIGYAQSV